MASVKVAVRVRPMNRREKDLEAKFIIQMEKSKTTITNLKASRDLALLLVPAHPCTFYCENNLAIKRFCYLLTPPPFRSVSHVSLLLAWAQSPSKRVDPLFPLPSWVSFDLKTRGEL